MRVTYLVQSSSRGWQRHKVPHQVSLEADNKLRVIDFESRAVKENINLRSGEILQVQATFAAANRKSSIKIALAGQPVRKIALLFESDVTAAELCHGLHNRGVHVRGMEAISEKLDLNSSNQCVAQALETDLPDISRPEVQAFIIRLLFQDSFIKFVGDLGELFNHVISQLPSTGLLPGATAMPNAPPDSPQPVDSSMSRSVGGDWDMHRASSSRSSVVMGKDSSDSVHSGQSNSCATVDATQGQRECRSTTEDHGRCIIVDKEGDLCCAENNQGEDSIIRSKQVGVGGTNNRYFTPKSNCRDGHGWTGDGDRAGSENGIVNQGRKSSDGNPTSSHRGKSEREVTDRALVNLTPPLHNHGLVRDMTVVEQQKEIYAKGAREGYETLQRPVRGNRDDSKGADHEVERDVNRNKKKLKTDRQTKQRQASIEVVGIDYNKNKSMGPEPKQKKIIAPRSRQFEGNSTQRADALQEDRHVGQGQGLGPGYGERQLPQQKDQMRKRGGRQDQGGREHGGGCGRRRGQRGQEKGRRIVVETVKVNVGAAPTASGRAAGLSVALKKIWSAVNKHSSAWPFRKCVDLDKVPDYLSIIKKPMDLQSILDRLDKDTHYTSESMLQDDLHLICNNAKDYNEADSLIYREAEELQRFIDTQF